MRIFFALVSLFSIYSCSTNGEKDLTVEEIWGKYINNYGNTENIKSYKSILIYKKGGTIIQSEFICKKPDKLTLTYKYPDDTVTIILNGSKAVEISKNERKNLPDDQVKSLKVMSDLYPEINFVQMGYKFKLIGKEKINDNETFKIKITKENKEQYYYYIDTKSFHLIKIESNEGVTYFSDYIKVNDFLCSLNVKSIINGQEILIEKKNIEFNIEIDDSIFLINK